MIKESFRAGAPQLILDTNDLFNVPQHATGDDEWCQGEFELLQGVYSEGYVSVNPETRQEAPNYGEQS
jgi:hypothetical protein